MAKAYRPVGTPGWHPNQPQYAPKRRAVEQKAVADLVKAAMRWHYYRERYAPLKSLPKYPSLEPMRWADDTIWDKLEKLEAERDAACERLALARRPSTATATK